MRDRSSENGQALLLGVLLVALLISMVRVLFFWYQSTAQHQVFTANQSQGNSTNQEGISYLQNLVSISSVTWANVLQNGSGAMPGTWNPAASIQGSNMSFWIGMNTTSSDPTFRSYDLVGVSTPILPSGQLGHPISALLSIKTLGITLPPNNLDVPAALEMMHVPITVDGGLTVHWGPAICLDTGTVWNLYDPMNAYTPDNVTYYIGYPRKFGAVGISSGTPSASDGSVKYLRTPSTGTVNKSDYKEYWSYAAIGYSNNIDSNTYLNKAENETTVGLTNVQCQGAGCTVCNSGCSVSLDPACVGSGSLNCGSFVVTPGFSAVFDTVTNGWNPGAGTTVIYVQGDVIFRNLGLDLSNTGAFIVVPNQTAPTTTGNLTLDSRTGGLGCGLNLNLNVPPTAGSEYYYWPSGGTTWPCKANVGGVCSSRVATDYLNPGTGLNTNFHGFLWVQGNLTVNPSVSPWIVSGAVLVGDLSGSLSSGQLNSAAGKLVIYYDDFVEHNILVSPFHVVANKLIYQ